MLCHKENGAERLGKVKPCDGVEMSLQRRRADMGPAPLFILGVKDRWESELFLIFFEAMQRRTGEGRMFIYDLHRGGGNLAFLLWAEMQSRDIAWIKVLRRSGISFWSHSFLAALLQLRPLCVSPPWTCRVTEKAFVGPLLFVIFLFSFLFCVIFNWPVISFFLHFGLF